MSVSPSGPHVLAAQRPHALEEVAYHQLVRHDGAWEGGINVFGDSEAANRLGGDVVCSLWYLWSIAARNERFSATRRERCRARAQGGTVLCPLFPCFLHCV